MQKRESGFPFVAVACAFSCKPVCSCKHDSQFCMKMRVALNGVKLLRFHKVLCLFIDIFGLRCYFISNIFN